MTENSILFSQVLQRKNILSFIVGYTYVQGECWEKSCWCSTPWWFITQPHIKQITQQLIKIDRSFSNWHDENINLVLRAHDRFQFISGLGVSRSYLKWHHRLIPWWGLLYSFSEVNSPKEVRERQDCVARVNKFGKLSCLEFDARASDCRYCNDNTQTCTVSYSPFNEHMRI